MIQMDKNAVFQYVKGLVEERVQWAYERDGEVDIRIDDVYDLNDLTIESEDICQIDRVYDVLFSMLPIIFDDIESYIDEIRDNYDDGVWGTYAMRETIGLCD